MQTPQICPGLLLPAPDGAESVSSAFLRNPMSHSWGSGRSRGAQGASPRPAGMTQNPPGLGQLSFPGRIGASQPHLCGSQTSPAKEKPGKSQGILALNVKSMETLEKSWECRAQGLPSPWSSSSTSLWNSSPPQGQGFYSPPAF